MAESAKEGTDLIKELSPDLVFLDIEMPHGSAFDLLESFGGVIDFEVVFTTAYDQYAIQAIKFAALDYLLKPIDIEGYISVTQIRIIQTLKRVFRISPPRENS